MKALLLSGFMLWFCLANAQKPAETLNGTYYTYNYDKTVYAQREYENGKATGTWIINKRNGDKHIKFYRNDSLRKQIILDKKKDTILEAYYIYQFLPGGQLHRTSTINTRHIIIETIIHTYKGNDSIKEKLDSSNICKISFHFDSCQTNEKARFKGGDQALQEFISNNLEYPEECKLNDIMGTVRISFTIEADGTLTEIRMEGPYAHPLLEKETLRVIKMMNGKFQPGTCDGQPFKSYCQLPISFEVENE